MSGEPWFQVVLRRLAMALAAVFTLLAVAACEPNAGKFDPIEKPAKAPVLTLSPGDTIRVTVFGEDKLSGVFQIDDDGFVSLPLAGTVKAAGLTKIGLERLLTQKLTGDYLTDPKITVEITAFRPFYILGEVEKPGQYNYSTGLNVISAMALAGGATYRASATTVYVQRGGKGEFKKYPLTPEVMIYPGDLVRVPERYF